MPSGVVVSKTIRCFPGIRSSQSSCVCRTGSHFAVVDCTGPAAEVLGVTTIAAAPAPARNRRRVTGEELSSVMRTSFQNCGYIKLGASIAPPGQEGWLRDQERSREATDFAQTGWLLKGFFLSDLGPPPRRALFGRFAISIDVRGTPPGQEGRWPKIRGFSQSPEVSLAHFLRIHATYRPGIIGSMGFRAPSMGRRSGASDHSAYRGDVCPRPAFRYPH